MATEEEKEIVLQLAICMLPKCNIDLLSVLVRFFVIVSSFTSISGDTGNKMNLDNLATVIAPNILYGKANVAENPGHVIEVVRLLFVCHQTIFKVNSIL